MIEPRRPLTLLTRLILLSPSLNWHCRRDLKRIATGVRRLTVVLTKKHLSMLLYDFGGVVWLLARRWGRQGVVGGPVARHGGVAWWWWCRAWARCARAPVAWQAR